MTVFDPSAIMGGLRGCPSPEPGLQGHSNAIVRYSACRQLGVGTACPPRGMRGREDRDISQAKSFEAGHLQAEHDRDLL